MSFKDDCKDKYDNGPEPRIDAAARQPAAKVAPMKWGVDPWGARPWAKSAEESEK